MPVHFALSCLPTPSAGLPESREGPPRIPSSRYLERNRLRRTRLSSINTRTISFSHAPFLPGILTRMYAILTGTDRRQQSSNQGCVLVEQRNERIALPLRIPRISKVAPKRRCYCRKLAPLSFYGITISAWTLLSASKKPALSRG